VLLASTLTLIFCSILLPQLFFAFNFHHDLTMPSTLDLTLFLWLEGFFPKTVTYYLLFKGIVNSLAQLYQGKTNDPHLKIQIIFFNGSALEDADPKAPKPPGKSLPCLRVVDKAGGGKITWINESSSILRFLEDHYSQEPRMMGTGALERAIVCDCLAAVYQGFNDCNYYIKNAAAVTTRWSGMRNEDRSLAQAKYAKNAMTHSFIKVQEWAAESLQDSGWLTSGIRSPGLVDVTLAAGVRYMELSYSLDLFEEEQLGPLRAWYARFKKSPWWEDYEESGRFPKEFSNPEDCREV
jgi:glutathione S-transferase